jgi:hypothetical protein
MSKLFEPIFHLIRLFLDNAYGTIILQASLSKYLIEYECVKNYISLNMNLLKLQMIYYNEYFVNCCPNKHAQRLEIVSI